MDKAQAAGSVDPATGPESGAPDVVTAVVRVLGLPSSAYVRDDTPLAGLGIDSLALLCIGDVFADAGWEWDDAVARSATSVGQLAFACRPPAGEAVL